MSSIGKISLDLNVNSKNFGKQIGGIKAQATKGFGAMSVAVGNIVANMLARVAAEIGHFVTDSISKGSELTELENVVESVFTTMSDKVDNFAKNALDSYGLTEKQAKKMVGTFGAMSKSFGYTEEQAYGMSTSLAALAGDVASFYDLSIDQSYTKMKSVFTGETESLKELGVVMTQTALDEFALARGFGKTTSQMSEQEKVALRLAFVQDRLKSASGDVIRTQDSWANQMRKLTGQIDSFKTAIGQGLINILTPVIKVINIIMGKLVQLANAFKSFTEMIMGKKASGGGGGGAGAAMAEVADAAESAAESTGGVEDAASGAAAAAKEAKKSLMGFDEINKLSKDSDSSSGGGGGGASGGGVSFDPIDFGAAVTEAENKAEGAVSKLAEQIKGLLDTFKDGFKAGLGDDFEASLERIKEHAKGIKDSIYDIFGDPKVQQSASTFASKAVYALGQISGAAVSIGTSVAENLVGGYDKYLEQNKDFIKQRIIGIFDVSGEISELLGTFAQDVASIFEVFRGENAKQCTADLIAMVQNAALGMTQLALEIGRDVLNCIVQPIHDNKDAIKEALDGALGSASTVLSTLSESVRESFDKVFEVYDSRIRPAFEGIAQGLSDLLGTILDVYNTYVAPVIDDLTQDFNKMWTESIQPTIDKAIEFIGKLATCVSVLFQKVVVPFISWLLETLVPVLMPAIKLINQVFMDVIGAISTAIGGLLDILGGILDFISGVFTGDWELCWEGIKSIFEGFCGIIEGLVTGLFSIIESIFQGAIQSIGGLASTIWETVVGIFTVATDAIGSLISAFWDLIGGVFSSGGAKIQEIVDIAFNFINNIITSILNTVSRFIEGTLTTIQNIFTTILTSTKELVSSIFNTIKEVISSVITNVQQIISTGLETVSGVFNTILTNVKNTVTNIFNGIWSVVKSTVNLIIGGIEKMVNGVVSGVNRMIRALNSISFDIPDWVPGLGGKSFGLSIPTVSSISLPRLAEGGYIKANQPTLAMVGDNKTQGEIVTPENKMYDVMLEALEAFFARLQQELGRSGGAGGGDITIPIYLDGTLLDEVIVTAQQRRNLRSGGR